MDSLTLANGKTNTVLSTHSMLAKKLTVLPALSFALKKKNCDNLFIYFLSIEAKSAAKFKKRHHLRMKHSFLSSLLLLLAHTAWNNLELK